MAYDVAEECRRLIAQFPGWHFWRSSPGGWFAVPAPDDITHTEALYLPNRLGGYRTPEALAAEVEPRYGWHDHCQTCMVLARECGHRQDETRD